MRVAFLTEKCDKLLHCPAINMTHVRIGQLRQPLPDDISAALNLACWCLSCTAGCPEAENVPIAVAGTFHSWVALSQLGLDSFTRLSLASRTKIRRANARSKVGVMLCSTFHKNSGCSGG